MDRLVDSWDDRLVKGSREARERVLCRSIPNRRGHRRGGEESKEERAWRADARWRGGKYAREESGRGGSKLLVVEVGASVKTKQLALQLAWSQRRFGGSLVVVVVQRRTVLSELSTRQRRVLQVER